MASKDFCDSCDREINFLVDGIKVAIDKPSGGRRPDILRSVKVGDYCLECWGRAEEKIKNAGIEVNELELKVNKVVNLVESEVEQLKVSRNIIARNIGNLNVILGNSYKDGSDIMRWLNEISNELKIIREILEKGD